MVTYLQTTSNNRSEDNPRLNKAIEQINDFFPKNGINVTLGKVRYNGVIAVKGQFTMQQIAAMVKLLNKASGAEVECEELTQLIMEEIEAR